MRAVYVAYHILLISCLTCIIRPLNPNVAAGGQSYFYFKCPSVHLSGTAFSLSSINRYI
jgi:hypothetical protein